MSGGLSTGSRGDGSKIHGRSSLRSFPYYRFDTFNETKAAGDKLAKWRQMKDVPNFNGAFHQFYLNIPDISVEEQTKKYSQGAKSYI